MWLILLSSRMLHGRFLFASPPCIPDLLMAKDLKAPVLHVSKLSIALPWIPNNSPQYRIALVIKKLSTPKLNTIWLEVLAKVLNMLIELKGNNYYSKVFKRVNYKLSNSTFWVVISRIQSPKLFIAFRAIGPRPRIIHIIHTPELFIPSRALS